MGSFPSLFLSGGGDLGGGGRGAGGDRGGCGNEGVLWWRWGVLLVG